MYPYYNIPDYSYSIGNSLLAVTIVVIIISIINSGNGDGGARL